jgi:hypothetical protein
LISEYFELANEDNEEIEEDLVLDGAMMMLI